MIKSEDCVAEGLGGGASYSKRMETYSNVIDDVINSGLIKQELEDTVKQEVSFEIDDFIEIGERGFVSENLKTVIEKLKTLAVASGCKGGEGKKRFFTPQVNELLLRLEKECRSNKTRPGFRTSVYAHLARHLPCNEETLKKRARNLENAERLGKTKKLSEIKDRLKTGIDLVMPVIKAEYEAECEKAAVSERNCSNSGEVGPATNGLNVDKKIYAPRKKFPWRQELRKVFFDIVETKLREYFFDAGIKSDAAIPFAAVGSAMAAKVNACLKMFLCREIKPLWPKGWMDERLLMKECSGLINNFLKNKGNVKS